MQRQIAITAAVAMAVVVLVLAAGCGKGGKDAPAGDMPSLNLPADLRPDVPVYPGMFVDEVTRTNRPQEYVIRGYSEDSLEAVEAFYAREIAAQGWENTNGPNYRKGEWNLIVKLLPSGKGTDIRITNVMM